jgi:ATP-binding cassette subfamily C protein EexD
VNWLFVKRLRPFVVLAGLASLVLNVTLLMPAIYMMQVFDRVFSSQSVETLTMLGIVTALFLGLGFFLDTVRVRALAWAGRSLERKLAPAAVRSSLEQGAAGPGRIDTEALKDIAQLRGFLSGPAVLAFFDAPWMIVFLAIITLMHPVLGLASALGAVVLVALGVLTHRLTRDHAARAPPPGSPNASRGTRKSSSAWA